MFFIMNYVNINFKKLIKKVNDEKVYIFYFVAIRSNISFTIKFIILKLF